MLLDTGTVTIPTAELRALCDKAEAKGYPTGPTQKYWKTGLPAKLGVEWQLHRHTGEFTGGEQGFSRNGGFCARICAPGPMRADIDLADLAEWIQQDLLRRIEKATKKAG